MGEIKVVTLSGSPRERGYQHGSLLKDGVLRFYDVWMKKVRDSAALRLTESDLLDFANGHASYTRKFAPDLLDEMVGIGEGAGLNTDQVVFMNCMDETDSLPLPQLAVSLVGLPPSPSVPNGCTSFAVFGEATRDGNVYIGQGYDMDLERYEPVVFRIQGQGGEPDQLIYSHMGVLGVSGINAAGIAIVENSLKPSDQRIGVPFPVVVRKALQQKVLSEFLRAIITAERACGQNYVIGVPYGAVDIETSATKWSFEYLVDGTFGHANHYDFAEMKPLERWAEYLPDSLVRAGRMRQLLKSGFGSWDLEGVKQLMRDHANYPLSICRHGQGEENLGCLSTLIYSPIDSLMLVTDGSPCCNPYQEVRIESPDSATKGA